MSQTSETGDKSFVVGGAIAANLRVKVSSGVLSAAAADEQAIGTLRNAVFASGDIGTVRLKTAAGTRKMVASGAITAGVTVYGDASGKVTSTANGNVEGIAFDAATADGDVIEVMASDVADAALGAVGVAAGYRIARGETVLDGSNPTPVTTGLTTCVSFVATIKGSAAPGLSTSTLTAVVSGGNANVYAWKPTGAGDTTLIASAGTESFYWIAIGT